MCFEMGCVNHESVGVRARGVGQFFENSFENTFAGPAHKPIVERFVRAVFDRRIAPALTVANNEDNTTRHTTVIDPGLAMGLGKEGLKARCLCLRQPERIAHVTTPFCRTLIHTFKTKSMGPEPRCSIPDETIRLCCPDLADVFTGREAAEGLEPSGEVTCSMIR